MQSVLNDIVGKNQEHIILEYDAPFYIDEYESIFALNETLENISGCGFDDNMLTALFKVNPDRDEVLEAIENETFDIINIDEVSAGWSVSFNRDELFGVENQTESRTPLYYEVTVIRCNNGGYRNYNAVNVGWRCNIFIVCAAFGNIFITNTGKGYAVLEGRF